MDHKIKYYYNNKDKKSSEEYWHNGRYHRDDGPAFISWHYVNSSIKSIVYMINGGYHRDDGPAYQYFDEDGTLIKEEYWLDDIAYTKFDWLIKTRIKKLKKLYEKR